MKFTTITLLLFSISTLAPAQHKLDVKPSIKLKIENPLNNIKDCYTIDDKIVLLSDTRESGDLNILIIVLDSAGNILAEKKIGKKNAFERPVKICEGKEKNYLLSNTFKDGKKKLILFILDKNYNLLEEKEININNLEDANDMTIKDKKAFIAVSLVNKKLDVSPAIIEYDLATMEVLNTRFLDNKNHIIEPGLEEVTSTIIDKNGERLRDTTFSVPKETQSIKTCNKIAFTNNSNEDLTLIGYENTETITDYWVGSTDEGNIKWEHVYLSKLGGDEAMDFFVLPNGNTLVTGIGYTKTIATNYKIRNILLDTNGQLIKSSELKDKTRTFYKGATKVGNNYAMIGQAEEVEYTNQLFNNIIKSSDVFIWLVDENLEELCKLTHETEAAEEVMKVVSLSENSIGVFYRIDEDLFLMHVEVN